MIKKYLIFLVVILFTCSSYVQNNIIDTEEELRKILKRKGEYKVTLIGTLIVEDAPKYGSAYKLKIDGDKITFLYDEFYRREDVKKYVGKKVKVRAKLQMDGLSTQLGPTQLAPPYIHSVEEIREYKEP